jgi:DNA polymerase I-like protein with 3'-5' exonuclease and polymerase domains
MALGFERNKAQKCFQRFFRDHHWISEFHNRAMHQVTQNGVARSPFGRLRRFPNPAGMKPEILSFYGQNPGSDILKVNALISLHTSLADFGARLLLTVHDQVLVSCPIRNATACKEHIEAALAAPIEQMVGFSIPATLKLGSSWGDVTSYEKWSAKRLGTTAAVS